MPDLSIEAGFDGPVIGVDEAGRGPWAGPVTIVAMWLNPAFVADLPGGLDDSKKLTARCRAEFHDILICPPHDHELVVVPVAVIDELGILKATLQGMATAAHHLAARIAAAGLGAVRQVLIDGNVMPSLNLPAQTVVKGDSRSLSIAGASVIAKHARDQIMLDLARQHPGYGWDSNMGYGTAAHRDGLAELGVTPHHRRSFAPIRRCLETDIQSPTKLDTGA